MERIFRQVNLDIFTVRERQVFHDDLENPKNPEDLAREVSPYLSEPEKMMLVRKMFKLATLDKEIAQEEVTMVYLIGRALGLIDSKIKEIETWVMEGINWLARWENIVRTVQPLKNKKVSS